MMRSCSIHGYTPADLQNMGMSARSFRRRSKDGSSALTLTPPQIENRKSKIGNRRKPRSKASHLPPDIQLNLNTMLARGCRYTEIIRYLSAQGYAAFNKVNIHNWRTTGFQAWLRATRDRPEADVSFSDQFDLGLNPSV